MTSLQEYWLIMMQRYIGNNNQNQNLLF